MKRHHVPATLPEGAGPWQHGPATRPADRTSAKSIPSGCETDGVRLCPVMGVRNGRERPSTPWESQRETSTVKHHTKSGARSLSAVSYASDSAMWTHAVFAWYSAMLDGSYPSNRKLGSEGARRRQTRLSFATRALVSASTAFLQAKALIARHTAMG